MGIRLFETVTRWSNALLLAAIGCLISAPAQAQLTFTNNFDSSWGSELSVGQTAVLNAEAILSSTFNNHVNVSINFSYGPAAGGGAFTDFNSNDFPSPFGSNPGLTYGQVRQDLQNASAANPSNTVLSSVVSHLPSSISSSTQFFIPEANALALGVPANQFPLNTFQGFITVGSGTVWDPTQSNGITAGTGDLTGVLLHEITHVMGRVDYSFVFPSGIAPMLTPLDLSRYTHGGGLNFTANNAIFSIDGGQTAIAGYSPTSDTGDWGSIVPPNDANNAFFNYGTLLTFGTADQQVMQALGWNVGTAPIPEPETYALLLAGLGLLGSSVRRRKQKAA